MGDLHMRHYDSGPPASDSPVDLDLAGRPERVEDTGNHCVRSEGGVEF